MGAGGSLSLVRPISSGGPGTGLFFTVISLGGSKVVHLTQGCADSSDRVSSGLLDPTVGW